MVRTLDRGLPPSAYQEYMRSPEWDRTRERWRRHRPSPRRRCRVCGSRNYHLHHRTYVRLGQEWLRDLVPLCELHHHRLHALQKRRGWTVERASRVYLVGAGARRGVRALLTTPPGWVLLAAALVLALR